MTELILDVKKLADRENLHDTLAAALHFPDWYGRNLDALFDCLTDLNEETRIVLRNADVMEERLGNYFEMFVKALVLAAEENQLLYVYEETE